MIQAELFESYGARAEGFEVDFKTRKNPKDPLGPLCRILIKGGYDPEDKLCVTRKGQPVFKNDRSIQYWADGDWVDTQTAGPHRIKYRPFSMPLGEKLPSDGPEVPDSPE